VAGAKYLYADFVAEELGEVEKVREWEKRVILLSYVAEVLFLQLLLMVGSLVSMRISLAQVAVSAG
jgi:hypothetical protein